MSLPDAPERAPRAEIRTLQALLAGVPDLEARLDRLSAGFLGRPYLAFSLVGGPETPERLVTRLDGFDCVTLVEAVLALARCPTPEAFEAELVALRYTGGHVDWAARRHYTHAWFDENVAEGRLVLVAPDRWAVGGPERQLTALEGWPPVPWTPRYLPRDLLDAVEVRTGDVAGFVSLRPDLDTFHVGLLVAGGPTLLLRHASRSRGAVIEEPLEAFLDRNEVPGLLLARPLPPRPRLA